MVTLFLSGQKEMKGIPHSISRGISLPQTSRFPPTDTQGKKKNTPKLIPGITGLSFYLYFKCKDYRFKIL
jgi:hypothetical protein